MNYKTTFLEKLSLFSQDLQDGWMKSLGFKYVYYDSKDLEGIIFTTEF